MFGLALRQAMGFVESFLQLSELHWPMADFSIVRRRQGRKLHIGIDAQMLAICLISNEGVMWMEWLPPAQSGEDQDELHQTAGRAGQVQDV